MLNNDTLTNIQKTAVNAADAKIVKVDDRRGYLVQGGTAQELSLLPSPRTHTVGTLDDLAQAAAKWGKKGAIWHSPAGIVLVVDDDDRRDRVTLELQYHPHFETLRKLEEQASLDQRSLVRLLKHDLAGVVPDSLLPKIRGLDVSTAGKQGSDLQHGRERGTREFQAELIGAKDIPETFAARVRVYDLPGLEYETISLSLDITLPPALVSFIITPLPNQLHEAEHNAQRRIGAMLADLVEDDGPPIFFGTP